MIFYPNPVRVGTDAVASLGDGYSINIRWFQAEHSIPSSKIAYHIYFATVKENVFDEGVKYVSIDGYLEANIIDLIPGQEYFFAVRPVEYDPILFDLINTLPVAYDNLRYYPTSILRQDISSTDLIIPLMDIDNFPNTGVIKIGAELIQYLAVDQLNRNLIVAGGVAPQAAQIIDQGGGNYYLPGASNIGNGTINSLTLINGSAITQTWTIKCIFVQRDVSNNPIPGTGKFISIGSISGTTLNQYGDPYVWVDDGNVVSNGVLSFSISDGSPALREGDTFIIKTQGAVAGYTGRGYYNTQARAHSVSGSDGYNTWNTIIPLYTIGESNKFDRIFACQSRFEYPNYSFTIVDGYHQVLKDILSTDLTASDAANVNFPAYDFAGYHRTDPVQLLTGVCVGSYIGGEHGCIDGYGNFNIVRGLNLQDENTQRQDVLLSITGRPAVLLRRMQTGITCACYLPSSEYPDDRCPKCFAAGTLVRAENGMIPIEQINIGDKVLSSDGKYYPVTKVFKTPFNGKLKGITTTTTTNPILATDDHPFLSLITEHSVKGGCGPNSNCKIFIKRGDGQTKTEDARQLPSGKWYARAQVKNHPRIALGTFDTKDAAVSAIREYKSIHSKPAHRLEWTDAKLINKNSWLTNKWNKNIIDINTISIPQEFQKNTKLGVKRFGDIEFKVDEEFMWMIGLYLAEGSSSKRGITFSLHRDETIYQNKIIDFFKKYNYNPKVYFRKTSKGAVVEVNGASLPKWFEQICGKYCYNKQIYEPFMNLPDNKIAALIQGIWDGDGIKRENEVIQTSETLCLQMTELLHRLGKQPMVGKLISKKLTPKGNKRKPAYRVSWEEPTFTHKNRKGRWQFHEQLLTKVKTVEDVDYSGFVYNLEVAGDHTYIIQNILVHNCYGTKFVFGYEQWFNPRRSDGRILVRVGPTDEQLKMQDAGLESEFPLTLWTLNEPTIKTRDILILFDQDDNEEFRYEVSTVTRNNTIVGLTGGQLFRVARIRKTDPAYQIRAFRNTATMPTTLNTTIGFVPGIAPHTHVIVRNEKDPSTWSQTTQVSQSHNHPVYYDANQGKLVVMEALGHSHDIII